MFCGRSQFPQFHDVEHVVLDALDLLVPALVKMAIETMSERVVFGFQAVEDFVHHLPFISHMVHEILVPYGHVGQSAP